MLNTWSIKLVRDNVKRFGEVAEHKTSIVVQTLKIR